MFYSHAHSDISYAICMYINCSNQLYIILQTFKKLQSLGLDEEQEVNLIVSHQLE